MRKGKRPGLKLGREVTNGKIPNGNPNDAELRPFFCPSCQANNFQASSDKRENGDLAQAPAACRSWMNGADWFYTPSGGWISQAAASPAFLCCTAEAPSSPS